MRTISPECSLATKASECVDFRDALAPTKRDRTPNEGGSQPQVAARQGRPTPPKQPELETSARARHVAAATYPRRLNEHVDRRCRHFRKPHLRG